MSATIPESMRLDDLLKATGYDCPVDLQGKTFDQATEGGGADLEDDKTVSITENGVVEITPSAGKDGMKKVTATVNVSGGGGGSATAYAWKVTYDEGGTQKTYYYYTTFAKAPADKDAWENEKILYVNLDTNLSFLGDIEVITGFHIAGADPSDADYQKDSDTQFTVIWGVDDTSVFTRDDTKDFTLWG